MFLFIFFVLNTASADFGFNAEVALDHGNANVQFTHTYPKEVSLTDIAQSLTTTDTILQANSAVYYIDSKNYSNGSFDWTMYIRKFGSKKTLYYHCDTTSAHKSWTRKCNLDFIRGDANNLFHSKTELIKCTTNTNNQSKCVFTLNTKFKELKLGFVSLFDETNMAVKATAESIKISVLMGLVISKKELNLFEDSTAEELVEDFFDRADKHQNTTNPGTSFKDSFSFTL